MGRTSQQTAGSPTSRSAGRKKHEQKHEQRQARSDTAAAPREAPQHAARCTLLAGCWSAPARHDKREGAEKMEGLLLGLAWTGWTRLG